MLEYGIQCSPEDEKKLVKNINAFLDKEYGYRKIYKWDHKSLLEARLPFVYSHYYCQFMKQPPVWYFELYPNTDLEGKTKFKGHPDCGWILFVNKRNEDNTEKRRQKVMDFFNHFIANLGYETTLLHQYKDKEDRL